MRRLRNPWTWIAAALAVSAAGAQDRAEAPVPTELRESVEVRLVTVDVVALDEHERTVADLGKDDFALLVDGKETAIDTLDVSCDGGPEGDPTHRRPGEWTTPKDLAQGTRRIVLAFDYMHLPSALCPDTELPGPCLYHTKALREYQRVLAAKPEIGDEEVMVAVVTGGLRVEQPFTRDREAVVETLQRMEHDVSLWNGNFSHLTESPLFSSLEALVTVLRTTPGPKVVVLVGVGPGPGDSYEREYERLAAAASDAQVAFYPVDCMGLFAKGRFT